MDYTKINLRDFRNKLTKLRDSGNVYTIIKKGELYGYFVPAEYSIKVEKKYSSKKQKQFEEILDYFKKNPLEFKDEVKDVEDPMEAYHKLLDMKYAKKDE